MQKDLSHRLDSIIRFFLYVLIFWLPYGPAVIETCVILSLLVWIIKRILRIKPNIQGQRGKEKLYGILRAFRLPQTPLNRPILFFVMIAFLSVLFSDDKAASWHGFITKTMEWFVIFYLFVETFVEKKHIIRAIILFIITAFATAIDALLQFYFLHKDIFVGREMTRHGATAAFHHANSLGGYMAVVISLYSALLFQKEGKKWHKALLVVGVFLLVWVLFITFSRSSWLAAIVGVGALLYYFKRKLFIIGLCALIFAGVVVAKVYPHYSWQSIRLDPDNIVGTMEWREGLWEDTLKMIKDRPLIGHGLNTYMARFQDYRRRPGRRLFSPTYAHNCYLQVGAETGLFGLGIFLWLIITLLCRSHFFLCSTKTGEKEVVLFILMGLVGGWAALLFHSFLDVDLYTLQLSALFWVIAGLIVSSHNVLRAKGIYGKTIVH